MIVQIQATEINLTEEEILKAVGPQKIMELKSKDQNPHLSVYSVVQEGMSKPRIIGEKKTKPIFWPREVIKKAGSFLKNGVKFFSGHGKGTNSHEGRTSVGEVVGTIMKEISGKLNQLVVGYFPDKDKIKNADICSIEADVKLNTSDNNLDIASDIVNLPGIALADSNIEKPGFAGAIRLASLQCFEGSSDNLDSKQKTLDKGRPKMDYDDFLNAPFNYFERAVRDRRMFPHQLFSEEEMKKDNTFGKLFSETQKKDERITELEKQLKESQDNYSTLEKDNLKSTAKAKLDKLLPEGLTDKQKAFINNEFNPDSLEDLSEDGIKSFIETSKNNFQKYAKVFGDENSIEGDKGSSKETGDMSASGINEDDIIEDMLNE